MLRGSSFGRRLGRVAALLTLVALPAPALATFPGVNGEIAFVRQGDIWAIGPDGSGLQRVTSDPAPERDPAWSPDGSRLAFVRERNGNSDIWTAAADGSDPRQVTTTDADEAAPAWSPDGTRLVFSRFRAQIMGFDLFIAAASGAGAHRIWEQAVGADWQPGGDRIAVAAGLGENSWIAFVGPDGQDYGLLPTVRSQDGPPGLDSAPSWAPDGSRLAYFRGRYDEHGGLTPVLAVNHFSTSEAVLDAREGFYDSSWSPDGMQVAYSLLSQIWIVPAAGGEPRQVTFSALGASEPAWRPIPPPLPVPSPPLPQAPAQTGLPAATPGPQQGAVAKDPRCARFPKVIRLTTAKMIRARNAAHRARTRRARTAALKRLHALAVKRAKYRTASKILCR
jgi:TolB protein